MTWLWLIFSSLLSLALVPVLRGGDLSGRVQLTAAAGKDQSGVVIWLDPEVPAHVPPRRVAIVQKNKTFTPHIIAISTGTSVDFPNLDPIFHNAFSSFDGKVFDVGLYPPGSSRAVRFDREGIVRVFCNIHPTMSAVIVVVNSPWFALSLPNGMFDIPNVPAGNYTLHVYHERATPRTVAALTHPVTVAQGRIDLPTIVISEAGYLPAPHKNKFGRDYPDHVTYGGRTP